MSFLRTGDSSFSVVGISEISKKKTWKHDGARAGFRVGLVRLRMRMAGIFSGQINAGNLNTYFIRRSNMFVLSLLESTRVS